MKIAQSSFVYFNFSLQEAIRRLHLAGYQGIEVWGGRPHCYRHDLDEQLPEIKGLLADLGMEVPNFIPAQFRYPSILCSLNETVRQDSMAYIRDAIDNAVALGAPYVSLCPGMSIYGEGLDRAWDQLRRSFMELLRYATDSGVQLLIEPAHRFESTLILTVKDGLRMINEIGSEDLGILLDTGHAAVNGEDLGKAVRHLKGIPLHIHIDDNHGDTDSHMVPGDGGINYAPLSAALEEIRYEGFISAELGFQYTLDPDPAVQRSKRFLQATFS